MHKDVSSRTVLGNLQNLKATFRDHAPSYKLLIHEETGEMRFAARLSERHLKPGSTPASWKWKEAVLIVQGKHFQITLPEMSTSARSVAEETVNFLNERAREVKAVSEIFRNMPKVRMVSKEAIRDRLGWVGSLSRIDAEKALKNRPVGTYLLREPEPLDRQIAFNLSCENNMAVTPYLMTVVEEDEKVVDKLLLETSFGWAIYKDEPRLADYSYTSLDALLSHKRLSPL